jgi:hypothetical protein
MAAAQEKGDQATIDTILAKYETPKNDSASGGKTTYGTGTSGNPGTGSGNSGVTGSGGNNNTSTSGGGPSGNPGGSGPDSSSNNNSFVDSNTPWGAAEQMEAARLAKEKGNSSYKKKSNKPGWYFDAHDPKRIYVDANNLDAMRKALDILSDPELGYYVTAYNDETGETSTFNNYSELNKKLNPAKKIQGQVFYTAEIDLSYPMGFEGSVSYVIDLEDVMDWGINFSGGPASGKNVGVSQGIGYVRRKLDGASPLVVDYNFGVGSVQILYDNQGWNGISIGIGPSVPHGRSISTQNSKTFTLRDAINWVQGK